MNPRIVDSIRRTVASLHVRFATTTASTRLSVVNCVTERAARSVATSRPASSSAAAPLPEVSSRPQRARSARRARSLCPFAACPADSNARFAVNHYSASSAIDGWAGGAGRRREREDVVAIVKW